MSAFSENSSVPAFEREENSSKDWAHSKRKRRFTSEREARFGSVNGHTARTSPGHRSSQGQPYTIEKITSWNKPRDFERCGHLLRAKPNRIYTGASPLEKELGFSLCDRTPYSLNKHKRWNLLDEALKEVEASEIRDFPIYHSQNKWHRGQDLDKVVAFYDDEEDATRVAIGFNNMPADEIPTKRYIRDTFWKQITSRHEREVELRAAQEAKNYWISARDVHPPGVTNPRLKIVAFRPTSKLEKTYVSVTSISKMRYKSVWCPAKLDDSRDFLTADLGGNMMVTHVGTKGRFPKVSLETGQPSTQEEYVRKYRLFYRLHRRKHWLPLGIFDGNSDRNTEVVHKLASEHTGADGIIAAEFRFQPLSKAEKGFKGRKAMRVALYGKPMPSSKAKDEAKEADTPSKNYGKSRLFDPNASGVFFHISKTPDNDEGSRFALRQHRTDYHHRSYQRREHARKRRIRGKEAKEAVDQLPCACERHSFGSTGKTLMFANDSCHHGH